MKMMRVLSLIILLFLFGFNMGCSQNKGIQQNSNVKQMKNENDIIQVNQTDAKKAENAILSLDEVYKVTAVNTDHTILLAYRVRQMDRFHLAKVEMKVKQRMNKEFPDRTFIVSDDLKLFFEINKLKKKLSHQQLHKDDLKKEIKKLDKLKEEKV